MRRTRTVLVALALGLLLSVVAAPAAGAHGDKGHAPKARCARLDERVARLQAKRARVGSHHGPAGDTGPRAQGHLAHIDDEIARAQAACI